MAEMEEKIRVLVVDDEEIVRVSYGRVLSGDGFCVVTAVDGRQALEAIKDRKFDVILLDLRMPGPDGLEILKGIKELSPESEVVIVTGYPSIDTAKEAVRLGAYDYLSKPVVPEAVIRATTGAWMQKRWSLQREPPVNAIGN